MALDSRLRGNERKTERRIGMKRSDNRILATHVGSLPRPPALIDMVRAKLRGEAVDPAAYSKAPALPWLR